MANQFVPAASSPDPGMRRAAPPPAARAVQQMPVAVGHVRGAVPNVVAYPFQAQPRVVHQRYVGMAALVQAYARELGRIPGGVRAAVDGRRVKRGGCRPAKHETLGAPATQLVRDDVVAERGGDRYGADALADLSVDDDVARLNRLRRKLVHFLPASHTIEVSGLPRISLNALSVVSHLAESRIPWTDQERAVTECSRLAEILARLDESYQAAT